MLVIKNNLRVLMAKNKWDIQTTAEKSGIHANTISAIYNDKNKMISYEVLEKLCRTFKCNVGDILEYQEKAA